MGEHRAMKTKFLTVYDYGTGGVWTYITAERRDDILRKYPKLQVMENDPAWFTNEDRNGIRTCDIDDDPDEFLVRMR